MAELSHDRASHDRRWALGAVFLALAMLSSPVRGATPFTSAELSPDVTVTLGGVTVNDEDVADDDGAGGVTLLPLLNLPAAASVNAHTATVEGDVLLSFETTLALPGGPTAEPADVVRFDGLVYTLEFDGSVQGVPGGAAVDAVSMSGTDLLLSFDTTVDLGGVVADDEDLVRFDGASFSLFFDASAAGVPAALDLDAADVLDSNDHLVLSFDGSGSVGGVSFDDEDVLEHDPAAGTWRLAYDGSARHPAWSGADLNAVHLVPVPEPSQGVQWAVAGACLALLRGRTWRGPSGGSIRGLFYPARIVNGRGSRSSPGVRARRA